MKTAIILGGTEPHIALIEKLKSRGYHTVLVDYYENPPAKVASDEHVRISTLDEDAVLGLAVEKQASLVISSSVDQANLTACYVGEKLGLPIPYSYQVAREVTNKVLMKDKMVSFGIPTSKHVLLEKFADLENLDLKFPVVVKPADCNGSAGVRRVDNPLLLRENCEDALSLSRSGKAIVEEFFEGVELSVDCYIETGEPHILLLREKFSMELSGKDVMQSPGSFSPSPVSLRVGEKLRDIAGGIARACGLCNSPLLLQVLINGDDVSVIEFAPRVGGGLSNRTVSMNTGFDLVEATLASYLGENFVVSYSEPKYYISTNIIYAIPCIYSSVEIGSLMEDGVIEEMHYYKTAGMEVGGGMTTKSRIGAFIVKADTKNEMLHKMSEAIRGIRVLDETGKEVMIRSVYNNCFPE